MLRRSLGVFAFAATAAVAQFTYDSSAPLGRKVVGRERQGDVLVQDITYSSPKSGLVPAYLFIRANVIDAPLTRPNAPKDETLT